MGGSTAVETATSKIQDENAGGHGKRRRVRKRNRGKKNKDSLIPPINPSSGTTSVFRRSDRHVAQDLYIAIRCSWTAENYVNRVLLANWEGIPILDCGVTQENFYSVRERIRKKIDGKVLIGHGVDYCLYALQIQHPWANLRDGATFLPFMKEVADPLTVMVLPRSLDDLAQEILDRQLVREPNQTAHDFLKHEAKACMDLYRAVRYDWENAITKLIQQKERQRTVKLPSPPLLDCISEDSVAEGSDLQTFNPETIKEAVSKNSLSYENSLAEIPEDHSTQAPTELLQEEMTISARDDFSAKTGSSDQSIWTPRQATTLSSGSQYVSSKKNSSNSTAASAFWGLWLPKQPPAQEGTHPIDADDLLEDDGRLGDPKYEGEEYDSFVAHLPSTLLNDSSSSEEEEEVSMFIREDSSHYVEGTDWLETKSARKEPRDGRATRLRRRSRSFEDCPQSRGRNLSNERSSRYVSKEEEDEESTHYVKCTDWLNADGKSRGRKPSLDDNKSDRHRSRSGGRSNNHSSNHTLAAVRDRSSHGDTDDWLDGDDRRQENHQYPLFPKFSIFGIKK